MPCLAIQGITFTPTTEWTDCYGRMSPAQEYLQQDLINNIRIRRTSDFLKNNSIELPDDGHRLELVK